MTTYDDIVTPSDWLCASCGRPRAAHTCLGGFQRRKYKFVGMMRIRNEERWIYEVIRSILPLCERVFVMDDHSTDNTRAMLDSLRYDGSEGQHVERVTTLPSPFDGLNESRDKNWLYDQIMRECEPEWILCIDGDEVLEKRGPDIIRQCCSHSLPRNHSVKQPDGTYLDVTILNPTADSYKLPIAYLWDSPTQWRTDRIYSDFWRPSLFRPFIPDPTKPDDMLVAKEFRFKSTPWGQSVNGVSPNFHCSSVPQRRIHGAKLCPARLKHYGYMNREDRVRKLDYLTSVDWKNHAEDWYRHVCQGDRPQLSELPKISAMLANGVLSQIEVDHILGVVENDTLVHAGPLRLEPWDESKPWQISEWAKGQG